MSHVTRDTDAILLLCTDAETLTGYRCALYELEAAEQEHETHIALECACQVAPLRRHAAAEVVRIKRREDALICRD